MLERLRASATWSDGMPKLVLDSGLTLHYQQVGDGPDVVMVHGITGNLAVWHLQLVPALSDASAS